MTGRTSQADAPGADHQPGGQRSAHRFTRRSVLRAVGLGGGAIVLAGAAGIGVRGGTNGVWNQGKGAPYELWLDWHDAPGMRRFVGAGTLAANPHNIQPWAFAVGQNTIDLYVDPARTMPVNDSDGRERIAGFGCAIENIVVAARADSLDARVDLWPDADDEHIARIALAPGRIATSEERERADAISSRHSNRGPYSSRAIDPSTLDRLAEGAPSGAEVTWISGTEAIRAIGDAYVDATQAIVDDEEMSRESFSWFRNDRADIDRHRDGLTLDCQGLDGMTLFLAKMLPAQSRSDGDAFWVTTTRDVHTATAQAYGIIRVTDDSDPRARIAGGRLLQHVHLTATTLGIGLQHMNQVSERMARDRALGAPDRFGPRWAAVTGVPADQSLLAFRVGYPDRAPNPSPRRAIAEIVR